MILRCSFDSSATSFKALPIACICSAIAPPANAPANASPVSFAASPKSSMLSAASFDSSPNFFSPVVASLAPSRMSFNASSFLSISLLNLLIKDLVSFAPTFNLLILSACFLYSDCAFCTSAEFSPNSFVALSKAFFSSSSFFVSFSICS